MNISALRLCASAIFFAAAAPAAQTNWAGRVSAPGVRRHASPVIARAIERREMRQAAPRVVSQTIMAGQLVSRMADGGTVVAPLRRAATARAPEAIARLRIDRALARIAAAAAVEGEDNAKRAQELEKLADKLEKEKGGNGKGKAASAAAGAIGGAAIVTAAYLASRKGHAA